MADYLELNLRVSPHGDGRFEVTAEEAGSGRAGPQPLGRHVLDDPGFQAALACLRLEPDPMGEEALRLVGDGLFPGAVRWRCSTSVRRAVRSAHPAQSECLVCACASTLTSGCPIWRPCPGSSSAGAMRPCPHRCRPSCLGRVAGLAYGAVRSLMRRGQATGASGHSSRVGAGNRGRARYLDRRPLRATASPTTCWRTR